MKNEQILDSKSINNTTIEIVQMSKLEGANSPAMCSNIFFIEHSNAALKFVRIKMDGTVPLKTETGALYYASGKIENNLQVGGVKGAISKVAKSVEDLKKQKTLAVQQVKNKYLKGVASNFSDANEICIYGIAFYKKECQVLLAKAKQEQIA